jgi:hypothetical protein
VNDEESLAVGWFALDALPPLRDAHHFRIKQALSEEPTWFGTTAV